MKNFYFVKDSNFTIVISKEINALPIIDTQLSHNKPCIFGERIEPSSKYYTKEYFPGEVDKALNSTCKTDSLT